MRKFLTLAIAAVLAFGSMQAFAQGNTTAGMNGRVSDENGGPLPNATIVAVHTPSGTQFAGISDLMGYYRIPNMDVGGPYTVTISYIGFKTYKKEGIMLSLGQTSNLNVKMSAAVSEIMGVDIIANQNDLFDGNRTGAETVVNEEQIQAIPSVQRSISDFTRLTPQASVDDYGAISLAGANNRYNAITIDGAVNNDVFGLAASGTNGGQTGGTPISIDAIEQFQVTMAPYDVRLGGFNGGAINAVTRRGSNQIEGSAYYFMRNEGMAGLTPTDDTAITPSKLPDFASQTYGFRLGGPIIKNKLFYFVNFEMQREETPQPFDFTTYTGNSTATDLTSLINKLGEYGYDPGGYLNNTRYLEGEKFLVRLDYSINARHKLSFRHSYVNNVATMPSASSKTSINFYNNGQYFPSVTNSTAMELKSNYDNSSNNLIIGFTAVRDDRDPIGDPFPYVTIRDGKGTINLGSETFSTGNQLDQDILTITDNFSIYKGKHTITIGTHNEFSRSYNLFMRQAYGQYTYGSIADFVADKKAVRYDVGYSLVDEVVGDGSAAAADFNTMQLGFYAQDEFYLNENLKLTYGVRLDIPIFSSQPGEDTAFNNKTIPKLEAAGWDLEGARAGQMPSSQLMWSPRVGFNWDVNGDNSLQIRGGVGIFTSRLPLVWPGGSYTNNGLTVGGYSTTDTSKIKTFNPEWDQQPKATDFGATDKVPSGQMDLFTENFKFPQVFRVNLAVDKKLPYGLIGTFEAIYSKTLNNVLYYNINYRDSALGNIQGGEDTRPYYSSGVIDNTYTRILLGTNTNEGYSYSLTAQLEKPLKKGFYGSLSYTYGRAMAMNDATSSQNSSQWRYMEHVNGLNHLDLSISDFDMGHRVLGFLSYRVEYAKHFATTISLVYNAQSGRPFSYVYNDFDARVLGSHRGINGEASENEGSLIWIPTDLSQINLVDIKDANGNVTKTAAQQWDELNAFIEADDYLSANRGSYAARNAARLPFTHIIDLKIAQDIFFKMDNNKTHRLQLTLDIFNFTNMVNADWGRRLYIGNDAYQLVDVVAFAADANNVKEIPQFQFKKPVSDIWSIDDSGVLSSRWQMQFGIRYMFP
jgi:hypothetical protein